MSDAEYVEQIEALVEIVRPRAGWDTPSRARESHGADNVRRYLWEAA